MVLSILSLTTTPSRIRFGIYCSLTGGLLAQHRLDAGDVAAHLAHAACLAELSAGLLEAQVESFLAQVAQLFLELVGRLGAQIAGLHGVNSSTPLSTFGADTSDEARLDRQLGRSERQRLLGDRDRHAVELEQHAA